jgi:hypothetical protein
MDDPQEEEMKARKPGWVRNGGILVALLSATALLVLPGTATAAGPTGQTLVTIGTPNKGYKKKFTGISLHTIISTTYDSYVGAHSPKQTVFTIPKDLKYVNGNIPACPLSAIAGKFTAQAQAACPQSITGGGTVEVNGGAIKGTVTFFSGGPSTIFVQTDIGPGATTLTIIGTLSPGTLTFTNIPDTVGLVLTKFDTTFNKRRTGKKTFYVMARCRTGSLSTTETTTFYSGEVLSAAAGQKCKQIKPKKK